MARGNGGLYGYLSKAWLGCLGIVDNDAVGTIKQLDFGKVRRWPVGLRSMGVLGSLCMPKTLMCQFMRTLQNRYPVGTALGYSVNTLPLTG